MEWKSRGTYLEAHGFLGKFKVFKGPKGRWTLEINQQHNIPDQRYFYSKNAALAHGNELISSSDSTIFGRRYSESGKIIVK